MKKVFLKILVLLFISSYISSYDVLSKEIKLFAGAVERIDINEKLIVLKNDKEGEVTFVIDEKTVIRTSEGFKSINDIKVGNIASLVYEIVDGKRLAKSITIVPRVISKSSSENK